MRGRIKRFIEDKGYGFITGEDGQDYFFHISQVRDMVEIKNYMIVNFDIADGKKGKNAVNISVSEQNNTSRFITLGNLNIRLSNIKEYGIETEKERYNTGNGWVYNVKYLYVTTFQNDDYWFREFDAGFNIFEKYNEINDAMKYGH